MSMHPNSRLSYAARMLSLDDMRAALADGAMNGRNCAAAVASSRGDHLLEDVDAVKVAAFELLHAHAALGADELCTAMHLAMERKCGPTVVQWLLGAGVDPKAGYAGRPWLCSASRGDTARVLLDAGADVSARISLESHDSLRGGTALHDLAANYRCDPGALCELVAAGADVHALTVTGKTPLQYALPSETVAATLLELGADPAAGTHNTGKSALPAIIDLVEARIDWELVVLQRPPVRGFSSTHVAQLVAAAAWHRRRHALLAIRGRYGGGGIGAPTAAEGAAALAEDELADDEAPADQSDDEAPADQSNDEAPADQSDDEAPADQSDDEAPADQSDDEAPAVDGDDGAPNDDDADGADSGAHEEEEEEEEEEEDDAPPADKALVEAASTLSLDGMRAALEDGASVAGIASRRGMPLAAAVCHGYRAQGNGADVDALKVAAFELLRAYGGLDGDMLLDAMLSALVCRCGPTLVQWLLDAGVPATGFAWAVDPWLRFAARADVARLLIEAGADVTVAGQEGYTALHALPCDGICDPATLRVLVEAGADVHALTADGYTPLDVAIARASFTAATTLLQLGADPGAGRGSAKPLLQCVVDDVLVKPYDWSDDVPEYLERRGPLVGQLVAAAAWHRRKHLLMAVRGRFGFALADAAAGATSDAAVPAAPAAAWASAAAAAPRAAAGSC